MSHFSSEDEVELQGLLKSLLRSVSERISGAPSVECAEEILLHLEETDKNFHNYEFVKYLRQYLERALGTVIDEETENCMRAEGQAVTSGQDTLVHAVTRRTRESAEYKEMMHTLKNTMMVVVESLINKFEEDQLKKEEMHRKKQHEQSGGPYLDNCSDSDSSFNQSYAFITHEQLQVIAEKLHQSQPKEVRWEALQLLCCAPPSDVLSSESWYSLCRSLSAALADPDPELSEKVLRFFAKTLSSSPLNVTREIYVSLAKSLESDFLLRKLSIAAGSAGIDVNRPDIARLLKQMRLMNDFQKEVTSYWIRHPEKYMEEIIESTLSLLSLQHERDAGMPSTEKVLEPIHMMAMLDIKATWFKRWMHGSYSRTVVLRLLEKKYKSLIVASLQQCVHFHKCRGPSGEEVSDVTHMLGKQHIGPVQRTLYTTKELEYIHFVHSLCLLGRLLIYTNGRSLFPVRVKNRKDSLSPTSLVMEDLRTLCDRTECAVQCLYQSPVIEALLAPIIALLRGEQAKVNTLETTLVHIADILARIATTRWGLSIFLYDTNLISAEGASTSAAHIIAQFTKRLLAENLPPLPGLGASTAVAGAFVFVCRQMYNTCVGLQVLRPYNLHECIVRAWRQACALAERVPTPVLGAAPDPCSQEAHDASLWAETLLDNLLNFAATPKGLLFLQQTGAMDECVTYMFSRFTKKLQVSWCEKFGYGVMVTQIAATAPGVAALRRSGFVQAIVVDLWSALECGRDDARVVQPRSTPMEPIDRSCQKLFLALVNLLSSSYAVWELLGQQPLPNKAEYSHREMPTSIVDLVDRLIAINSDEKIHSLFNYEQSHTFGLRLLSAMCCSLDSLLLLESQYRVSETLLQNQKDNTSDPPTGQREFIIDGLSVERNHILVRMGMVGGPSERRLPPRSLEKGADPYPWPMFSSYPLPKCYIPDIPKMPRTKGDTEMSHFLASWKGAERKQMDQCRLQYVKVMTSQPSHLTTNGMADLLEATVLHLSSSPSDCFFPLAEFKGGDSTVTPQSLTPMEQLGVQLTIRYGDHLGLLEGGSERDLCLLVTHCRHSSSDQQAHTTSTLSGLRGRFPGYDWFAATAFLLMSGDRERTWGFLLRFSSLLASAFLWPARLRAAAHLPKELARSEIPPVYSCTAHFVEMLLKAEVPLVSSAFQMSGFTPSQICLQWLSQCFWNYLDWMDICHYVCTCVLLGPDYQVYVCVAVLKHLQQSILQHAQAQDLQVFLKEEPIRGFRVTDYLEFMEGLERTYRPVVLEDMRTFLLGVTANSTQSPGTFLNMESQ
ncbi:protein broad-minded isoform X2 [Scleropages formosus]|uniref:Protein broad-minded n=1 Tax=Scleropages formosus TaxID=113540 RepID=A0A8C9WCP4_SCLFO|nr:protein broad-minded isoform X2 [Scleropages formosus]